VKGDIELEKYKSWLAHRIDDLPTDTKKKNESLLMSLGCTRIVGKKKMFS